MLLYQGKSPFSVFRLKKLINHLQKKQPDVMDVSANSLYLIQAQDLTQVQNAKLISIIDPTSTPWPDDHAQPVVFVTPRIGTISPWSSKATDILHVCGFSSVTRVERGMVYRFKFKNDSEDHNAKIQSILPLLHDRMTQVCHDDMKDFDQVFSAHHLACDKSIPLNQQGLAPLKAANQELGLALSEHELHYLYEYYLRSERNPTEAELMMFAQVNSEHCRHKIFNARWTIDGQEQARSLFAMIRHTYTCARQDVLSAYKDNAAILAGQATEYFFANPENHSYEWHLEPAHKVIKVETHNHPSAIAPFEGAATGAGGEIRDEGATGIGGRPKAGLVGFSVSNLHIPTLSQPWEQSIGYPEHIASSFDVMLQAPIGAASFNNEFGRPNICGYFRTFEMPMASKETTINIRGYHKPIMIAGGLGHIRPTALEKSILPVGAKLIVLGGPAMLIGLGGSTASSLFAGGSHEELDFASVQRSNPEMERRCQEVINACTGLGARNPIISIHDVGAGGLSNAFPELVHDSGRGALFDLRAIPTADSGLNAMEIWCNEAQERYVLAVKPSDVTIFEKIANRERCPFAVVGEVNDTGLIELSDSARNESPIKLPLSVLFGEASKIHKKIGDTPISSLQRLDITLPLKDLIQRVLQLPAVADKSFLITIGDRTVTGLVARDQMVGPWQIPVSDVGVTASGYNTYAGEAMAMGERSPVALLNARACARMAVGEAITNILAADVEQLSHIKLSANWMAAANEDQEARKLFEAVHEVGMELCPALGICIPVGKDSLSMQMKWKSNDCQYNVISPLSLIISAFAPVNDIRKTLTPLLVNEKASELLLIDIGKGKNRLGASSLAQVIGQLGLHPPDLDEPSSLIQFFNAIKSMRDKNLLLAYHDRSDGGLLATICEMSFASHLGLSLELKNLGDDYLASLFNEELGALIQYSAENKKDINELLNQFGLFENSHVVGHINNTDNIIITYDDHLLFESPRTLLHRVWSQTSYQMQSLRDNPDCATQEYDELLDQYNPGLQAALTFTIPATPPRIFGAKPKVAILREQGVNGHMEMAAAFDRAGFEAIDVHMSDILAGDIKLPQFQGLVACGGFSYGDVLGAGRGWANSILFNEKAREQFIHFFNLSSVFVLGVCNGCQMLSNLKEIIPGANSWPHFSRNTSEQFEARLSLVKVRRSASIFFQGMEDSLIPIAVSHGEGKVDFEKPHHLQEVLNSNLVPLQYVDNYGKVTEKYPANPNGSVMGITALTNTDGRFTIVMPHGERVFRSVQFSWRPKKWYQENSPWFQLFMNARNWLK